MEIFQISFSIVGSRAECQNSDRKDNPQEITVHHTFDKGLGFKIHKNAYNSH